LHILSIGLHSLVRVQFSPERFRYSWCIYTFVYIYVNTFSHNIPKCSVPTHSFMWSRSVLSRAQHLLIHVCTFVCVCWCVHPCPKVTFTSLPSPTLSEQRTRGLNSKIRALLSLNIPEFFLFPGIIWPWNQPVVSLNRERARTKGSFSKKNQLLIWSNGCHPMLDAS